MLYGYVNVKLTIGSIFIYRILVVPLIEEDTREELNWISSDCGLRRLALCAERRRRQLRFLSSNSDKSWNLEMTQHNVNLLDVRKGDV